MSVYDYGHFISDFAKRTKINLEIVEDSKYGYEVTQLINSLFGLLILPYEKYKYRSKGSKNSSYYKSDEDMRESNTKAYEELESLINIFRNKGKLYSSYTHKDRYNVSMVIKHMRNAMAHSGDSGINIYPFAEHNSEIDGIIFFDSYRKQEFILEMTIEEIKQFIELVSEIYEVIDEQYDLLEETNYKHRVEKIRLSLKQGLERDTMIIE